MAINPRTGMEDHPQGEEDCYGNRNLLPDRTPNPDYYFECFGKTRRQIHEEYLEVHNGLYRTFTMLLTFIGILIALGVIFVGFVKATSIL